MKFIVPPSVRLRRDPRDPSFYPRAVPCQWLTSHPARLQFALLDPQVARERGSSLDPSGSELRKCVIGFDPRRGDGDLEHRNQLSPTRLCFNSGRHGRLTSVGDHDDITGLGVRCRVLEEAEVVPVVSWTR
jgi:hypothetical protein